MDSGEIIYFDAPKGCTAILLKGKQVVYTGCTLHQEPAKYRGAEALQPLLEEDFHFFFEDEDPDVRLYAVPELLILGYDSAGGYFATTRMDADFREDFPLFYLSSERKLYAVEGESRRLLTGKWNWRENLRPSGEVKLYLSREMAEKELEIHDLKELNLPSELQ